MYCQDQYAAVLQGLMNKLNVRVSLFQREEDEEEEHRQSENRVYVYFVPRVIFFIHFFACCYFLTCFPP